MNTQPKSRPVFHRESLVAPAAPISVVAAAPEFCDGKQLRLLFGISRTHAYLLASEGKIRSVSLRKPGAVRGRRLFDCNSIRAYLRKCARSTNAERTERIDEAATLDEATS